MPFTATWTLLPIVAALVAYWLLLRHTLVSGHWAMPALLAASVALLVLALNLVWSVALRRRRFTHAAPSTWRDGQTVVFEAQLQAGDTPLFAPATGAECALYTWRMERRDGRRTKVYGNGLALANTTVMGPAGPVRLAGLPNPSDLPVTVIKDRERLARFARHLLGGAVDLPEDLSPAPGLTPTPFTDMQKHAIATRLGLLSEAEETLRFEYARPRETGLDHTFGDAVLPWAEARAQVQAGAVDAGAARFADAMRSRLCVYVLESALPAGAPVCIIGTWSAARQQVLIDAHRDPAGAPADTDRIVDTLKPVNTDRRFRLIGCSMEAWIRRGWQVAATLVVLSLIPLLAMHYLAWQWLGPGVSSTPYPAGVLTPGDLRRWQRGDLSIPALALGKLDATNGRHTPSDEERLHFLRGLLAYGVDLSGPRILPALQRARLAELQLLLDHGADPDASGAIGDSTALHAAAWSADVERIDLLLRAGADPERKTTRGWTPLKIVEARAADPDAALDAAQSERAITMLRDAASRR